MIKDYIYFDLYIVDWTAIGAIVTALMMVATFITVIQNRNQVRELKRQWEDENRPKLFFSIEISNRSYFLRIANEGNSPANNINIKISEPFISKLREPYNWIFEKISETPFSISAHSQKNFMLDQSSSEINKRWKDENFDIHIVGTYNNKYNVDVKLPIQEYIGKVEFIPFPPVEQSLEFLAYDVFSEDGKKKSESILTILKSIRDVLKEYNNGTRKDK